MSKTLIISNPQGDIINVLADELEVSDGHHTMSELYNHRHALFAALVKIYDNYITPLSNGARIKCWKSRLHSDGTMFDGWFIAGIIMREHNFDANASVKESQISYHLPLAWWNKFNVMEIPNAPVWDGHTSNDVIERLLKL